MALTHLKHSCCTFVGNGQRIATDGGALDAATVAGLFGASSNAVIIRLLPGRTVHFDPYDPIVFSPEERLVFKIFADGALYRFVVAEAEWVWGEPQISLEVIRAIAGMCDHCECEVIVERGSLLPDGLVDLATLPPPRISVRNAVGFVCSQVSSLPNDSSPSLPHCVMCEANTYIEPIGQEGCG